MRVLHLNAWERSGGAARAANRLHRGLRSIGVESRMLVRVKETDDESVVAVEPTLAERHAAVIWSVVDAKWIANNRTDRTDTWFSSGRPGHDVANHPWVVEADVLNLHWVPGLLASSHIAGLLDLGKPVVWTLHDEWAFTGGCHYTAGCDAWRGGCAECPQLRSDPHGYVAALFADKRIDLGRGDLTVVAPSRWLADRAAASALLGSRTSLTIPYGLELDVFHPDARARGRAALGVDEATMLILFAASDARERRKGFAHLHAALGRCANDTRIAERLASGAVRAVTMGVPGALELPIQVMSRGLLETDAAIAATIAACDLYVIPSLEDNLPNGVLEALACGTPVLGFASGGIPEAVGEHGASSLVPRGDVPALAEQLALSILRCGELRAARPSMRADAERRFALERQACDYGELYGRLLRLDQRGLP